MAVITFSFPKVELALNVFFVAVIAILSWMTHAETPCFSSIPSLITVFIVVAWTWDVSAQLTATLARPVCFFAHVVLAFATYEKVEEVAGVVKWWGCSRRHSEEATRNSERTPTM